MVTSVRDRINEKTPSFLRFGYGTVYLNTTRGLGTLKKLSNRRFFDYWGDLGILAMFASMISFTLFLTYGAINTVLTDPPATPANNPKNVLAIPGLNDFIPLNQTWMFVAALFIAMVVHEGGHAISSLREDIDVEEWGIVLLLGIVPIGAYVLPDEEKLERQPFRPFSRVFSAGIMNNYLVTALTTLYFIPASTPGLFEVFGSQVSIAFGNTQFFTYSTLTIFVYWNWFININLALINTLPISALDGGQVAKKVFKYVFSGTYTIPVVGYVEKAKFAYFVTGIFAFSIFIVLLFGPLM